MQMCVEYMRSRGRELHLVMLGDGFFRDSFMVKREAQRQFLVKREAQRQAGRLRRGSEFCPYGRIHMEAASYSPA